MGFKKIAKSVAGFAPLLGTILGGPAGGAAGALISSALGVRNDPDAVAAAMASDPEGSTAAIRELELTHKTELARMTLESETAQLAQVNATYRAEIASGDKYVARMRPTFGYIVAASILAESFAIIWVIFADPSKSAQVVQLVEALSIPQSIALGVLGVYIKKRSDEKGMTAGYSPPSGLLSGLLGGKKDG